MINGKTRLYWREFEECRILLNNVTGLESTNPNLEMG
jgi:hypothetical protein